jgi:hypothetical protein
MTSTASVSRRSLPIFVGGDEHKGHTPAAVGHHLLEFHAA